MEQLMDLLFQVNNPRFVNVRRDRSLTNIDITLLDEWNELLELPEGNGDFQGQNFAWSMELLMEL